VTNLVKSNLGAGKREIAAGLKSGRSGAKKALERMLANMDKFD
jgi:hypothetical protein